VVATFGFSTEVEGRFFVQVSEGLHLEAETGSYPALGEPAGTPQKTVVLLHATKYCEAGSGGVEVATLLHVVGSTTGPVYRLAGSEEGWIVSGSDEALRVSASDRPAVEILPRDWCDDREAAAIRPEHESGVRDLPERWRYSLVGDVTVWVRSESTSGLAVGTKAGRVVVLDREGVEIWSGQCEDAITAMTFFGDDLIVGTLAGVIRRFGSGGREKWKYACTFREERSFWPWWFLDTPRIGALAVGHDAPRDVDVIAAGTGSTNLCFFDATTGELLDDVVSPYGLPDLIRPHTASGSLSFLVGHGWLTCGSAVRSWLPFPDAHHTTTFSGSVDPAGRSVDGWDTCGVIDFWSGGMVEGEADRLVVLRHGAVNQVTVYDVGSGDPLWDATLGGVPVALAVLPGISLAEARVYAADQFGWLVGFDGHGTRTMGFRAAQNLQGMHVGEGRSVALWNEREFLVVQGSRVRHRYILDGIALGWHVDPAGVGLLCVTRGHLVMKELSGWED